MGWLEAHGWWSRSTQVLAWALANRPWWNNRPPNWSTVPACSSPLSSHGVSVHPQVQFCNSRISILFFYLCLKFYRPKIKSPNLSVGWDPRIHAILTLGYRSSLHKASKRGGAPCLLQSQVQGTPLVPEQSLWMPTFPHQFCVQFCPSRKSHALPSSRVPSASIPGTLPRSHQSSMG